MEKVLGIDFGMTYTKVCLFEPRTEQFDCLEIDETRTIPTALLLGESANQIQDWGAGALNRLEECPSRVITNFKKFIGIHSETLTPWGKINSEDLCFCFLKILRQKIEEVQFNDSSILKFVKSTLIGCPGHWSLDQREALKKVAINAGFPDVSTLSESLAAAAYHFYIPQNSSLINKNVVILDFGSYSTDIGVIQFKNNGTVIPKHVSSVDLGGFNFDLAVSNFLSSEKDGETVRTQDDQETRKLLHISRFLKESLWNKSTVRHVTTNTQKQIITYSLSREDLEKCCEPVMSKLRGFIGSAFNKYKVEFQRDLIILISGGTGKLFCIEKCIGAKILRSASHVTYNEDSQFDIARGLAAYLYLKPKILEGIKKDLSEQIEQTINEIEKSITSRSMYARLKDRIRSAIKKDWDRVSYTDLTKHIFSLEKSESFAIIRQAINEELRSFVSLQIQSELNRHLQRLEDSITETVKDVVLFFDSQTHGVNNSTINNSVGTAFNDIVKSTALGVVVSVSGILSSIVASQLLWSTTTTFLFFTTTVFNPLWLLAIIPSLLVSMVASKKIHKDYRSFQELLLKKIFERIDGGKSNEKNNKGVLHQLWKNELEPKLRGLFDNIWEGKDTKGELLKSETGMPLKPLQEELSEFFSQER